MLFPRRRIPLPLSVSLQAALNIWFFDDLCSTRLDFLRGKRVRLRVDGVTGWWCVSRMDGGLLVTRDQKADVSMAARLSDWSSVVLGQTDPDELFFRRRLRITGDVDLALAIKNHIAGKEPPPGSRQLHRLLRAIGV